jgi:acyl carrier protein
LVVESLAARAARVLGCEVERVELARPLTELGLDSLTSFELRNWVEQSFGVPLAVADLVHWPSVDDLADRILELLDAETPRPGVPVTEKVANQDADDLPDVAPGTPREGLAAGL